MISFEHMTDILDVQCRDGVSDALRGVVEGAPDALLIFAGAMTYDETRGEYVTAWFDTHDENSALSIGVSLPSGGRDRVRAAYELHRLFPQAYLVAMSKTRDATKPTYASVTAKELIEIGVARDRILLQEISIDTVTELKQTARLSIEYGWSNIALIVSQWQVPRAEALLNHIEDFAQSGEEQLLSQFVSAVRSGAVRVQFLNTTTILSTLSDSNRHFFEETLPADPGMQARRRAEEGSLKQIAEGTYGGRVLTHKIWDWKL
jgi:hypothetical protein